MINTKNVIMNSCRLWCIFLYKVMEVGTYLIKLGRYITRSLVLLIGTPLVDHVYR